MWRWEQGQGQAYGTLCRVPERETRTGNTRPSMGFSVSSRPVQGTRHDELHKPLHRWDSVLPVLQPPESRIQP